MGNKVKCPGCGAKNDAASRRCRVCTTIINMNAGPPEVEPVKPVVEDVFDAGVINRQIQPGRAKFESAGGGLSARISAASSGGASPPVSAPVSSAMASPPGAPMPDIAPSSPQTLPPAPDRAMPQPIGGTTSSEGFGSADPGDAIVFDVPSRHGSTPPPIEYEGEKFDPNGLFS